MLQVAHGIYNIFRGPEEDGCVKPTQVDVKCYKWRNGIVVGPARATMGLIQSALVAFDTLGKIFKRETIPADNRKVFVNGLENFGKGLLSIIPIIGGLANYWLDSKRAGAADVPFRPILQFV